MFVNKGENVDFISGMTQASLDCETFVLTAAMIADGLTKPIAPPTFGQFRRQMGMVLFSAPMKALWEAVRGRDEG